MKNNFINISTTHLDLSKVMNFFDERRHGGLNLFIGKVRNLNLGKKVLKIEYDILDQLAIKIFQEICKSSKSLYDQDALCYIEHFKGLLNVGEISIIVAASSMHREESFKICKHIIEEIKYKAPIWKKEYYSNGASEWVKGHSLCKH